jgi:hypothetical protein
MIVSSSAELYIIGFFLLQIIGIIVWFLSRDRGHRLTEVWGTRWYVLQQQHESAELRQEDRLAEHVERLQARWRSENLPVHFGPVGATYYGDSPDHMNTLNPDRGALGLVDDRLLFVGMSSAGFEIAIPLSAIRWISQLGVEAQTSNTLTIYREVSGEWRLILLATNWVTELVQAMQQIAQVPISTLPDYGPIKALRARQEIYGQWDRQHTVTLYLAPDRLLTNWHSAVPLDSICELAVIPAAASSQGLLRIHFSDPDGRPQTIGFEMDFDRASAWAWQLSRRTGIAVDQAGGRKKKEDD